MSQRCPNTGSRVAHRALDNAPRGGALAGVVEEVIGDSDSKLIVVRAPDGERVGFDQRELRILHSLPGLSGGPVILHPRHLIGLLVGRLRRSA